MKKILCPTDFSTNANNALVYAIQLANHLDCKITLLHTYRIYSNTGSFQSVRAYAKEEAARSLLEVVNNYGGQLKYPERLETRILSGDAIPLITDMARIEDYEIIVMGTQGASGMKEVFIGSVTNGVIKRARTPVLAIPEQTRFNGLHNIVFAVDGEKISSSKVTETLVYLARKCQAAIGVYHLDIGEPREGIDPSVDMYLEGVTHSFHYELSGDSRRIDASIHEFAEEFNADLLCMIRRRRSFLQKLFHHSHTSESAFHSRTPLLVLFDD